jgi:hypothetical protein
MTGSLQPSRTFSSSNSLRNKTPLNGQGNTGLSKQQSLLTTDPLPKMGVNLRNIAITLIDRAASPQ